MGTRNLTAVFADGEYKIAQYGQWDGYPEGQGKTILKFLEEDGNIEKLKFAIARCRYMEPEGRDKEFLAEYEKNTPEWSNQPDNRTAEQKRWFNTYISRDIGGEILENIANSEDKEILLRNKINFAADSLFCEWCYVIDFDNNTFEVFIGFNHDPLAEGDRFYSAKQDEGKNKEYFPVKLIAKYFLSDLPTLEKFYEDCKEDEEDE